MVFGRQTLATIPPSSKQVCRFLFGVGKTDSYNSSATSFTKIDFKFGKMESRNHSPQSVYPGIRIGNPFNFKVGQVFTGFGIGCGVGIGVGRPLNLAAIPVLNQVMSATQGATGSFSVIGRHVNASLRKLGAKNVEAGIGCGVGFGHGFGVGFALKPGAINQLKTCLVHITRNMISKFGIAIHPDLIPASMKSIASIVTETPGQNKVGHPLNSDTEGSNQAQVNDTSDEVVKADFQSFHSKGIKELNDKVVKLQLENDMIKMVLRHEKAIEELVADNEKLKHLFSKNFRTPDGDENSSSTTFVSSRNLCFDCRRKQRRNR